MYRTEITGGGVSVYVRSTLPSSFMPQLSSVAETSEICAVEIVLGDNNRKYRYNILGIYRPPAASLPAFSDQIENIMTNFLNESVLLVGDFNIDLLCDTRNENFLNLLYSYNFSPLINVATRETNISSTCIDHIWFKNYNVSLAGSIIADISDHYPIFAMISTVNNNKIVKKTFRDHSASNIEDLCNKLGNARDEYFAECDRNDVNLKCEWLLNKLNFLYFQSCPLK